LQQKWRCEIGSLIIEPAIRCGTREPARITIQENTLLRMARHRVFPIHSVNGADSPQDGSEPCRPAQRRNVMDVENTDLERRVLAHEQILRILIAHIAEAGVGR
jgi:hypothetical protein